MTRSKVVSEPAPQTKVELGLSVARIAAIDAGLGRIEAKRTERVAAANTLATEESAPLIEERKKLVKGVVAFCESHRDELTHGGKTKTVKLPSGVVRWRLTPPAIKLTGAQAVLDYIRSRRPLRRFLRFKVEVNRQALLAEPDVAKTIPGVSITQREEFIIEPRGRGEIVAKTVKLPAS